MATQKAIIYAGPGKFDYVDKPVPEVKLGTDVLIKILACSICGTDVHILADPPEYPAEIGKTIGHELVGEVVEIGNEVISVEVGDHIIMDNNLPCGVCECCRTGNANVCPNMKSLGMEIDGAFAQYCVCPESNIVKINKDVPIEKAIFAEPLNCVFGGLSKLKFMPGDSVLVLGGGPMGMYFTKLSKQMGAGKVFVSEVSEFRKKYILENGADRVINPMTEKLSEEIRKEVPGGVDIVIECVGFLINDALDCIKPGGQVLLFGLNDNARQEICQGRITRNGITVYGNFIGHDTLQSVANGLNSGQLDFTNMITHRLPLSEFGVGLDAMRKGTGIEVVLYPWGMPE